MFLIQGSSDRFFTELDGGFATNEQIPVESDAYGYESDSDLDDSDSEALEEELTKLEDGLDSASSDEVVSHLYGG